KRCGARNATRRRPTARRISSASSGVFDSTQAPLAFSLPPCLLLRFARTFSPPVDTPRSIDPPHGSSPMFGRLMPREGNFFELFNRHAECVTSGSHSLAKLMTNYADVAGRRQYIDAIDRAEKDADKVTHETVTLLHKTFITPFDRDDIHQLITNMDDILDLIQDVAESAILYDLQRV